MFYMYNNLLLILTNNSYILSIDFLSLKLNYIQNLLLSTSVLVEFKVLEWKLREFPLSWSSLILVNSVGSLEM